MFRRIARSERVMGGYVYTETGLLDRSGWQRERAAVKRTGRIARWLGALLKL
jgi:hypothetical protein